MRSQGYPAWPAHDEDDVVAVTDVVRSGATGLLVPPRQPPALAAALAELLSDPGAASALGASARCWVRQELSLERMLRRYEDLYRGLAAP